MFIGIKNITKHQIHKCQIFRQFNRSTYSMFRLVKHFIKGLSCLLMVFLGKTGAEIITQVGIQNTNTTTNNITNNITKLQRISAVHIVTSRDSSGRTIINDPKAVGKQLSTCTFSNLKSRINTYAS